MNLESNFLTNLWPNENVVDREHGDDCEHLVGAAHFSSCQQYLGLIEQNQIPEYLSSYYTISVLK